MIPRAALRLIATAALFGAAACGTGDDGGANASTETKTIVSPDAYALTMSCSGCHGSESRAIVSLDTLDAAEIASALKTYKAETEGGTVMHRIARGYSDDEIDLVAETLDAMTP